MPNLENWQLEAMVQLVLAAGLGGLIGLEREYHGRAAGFRTHLLVGLGCCLVMIMSLHFEREFANASERQREILRIDPARLAYSIMGGIGFLGAGAIIKHGVGVRGLTTAASLWCTAAVGMACGLGMYAIALFTSGIVLFTLFALHTIGAMFRKHWYKTIRVVCEDKPDEIEDLAKLLTDHGVHIVDTGFDRNLQEHTVAITFEARFDDRGKMPNIYRVLAQRAGVRSVRVI